MTPGQLLVVGGSRGLGRAFSESAVTAGLSPVVIARTPGDWPEHCIRFPLDITDTQEISGALAQLARERGMFRHIVFCQRHRCSADAWNGEFETSVAATNAIMEWAPHILLERENTCSIVMLGSVAVSQICRSASAAYHVARAALLQLARYHAIKLRPRISVNMVSCSKIGPGNYQPVVDAIWFLLGAKGITGHNLVVDGGQSLIFNEASYVS